MAKTKKTAVKRTATKAAATAKKSTKKIVLTNKEKAAALASALAAKQAAAAPAPSAPPPVAAQAGRGAPVTLGAPFGAVGQNPNPPVDARLQPSQVLVDGHAEGVAVVLSADAVRELAERDAQAVQGADGVLRVPDGPDAVIAKPASPAPQGIHPDVTSPIDFNAPKLGTGVAKLHELAPGQSLAPSPPVSSSNILPQPEKPSFG